MRDLCGKAPQMIDYLDDERAQDCLTSAPRRSHRVRVRDMKRIVSLAAIILLTACGSGPSLSGVPAIDHTPNRPVASAPMVVLMQGQSNAARGTAEFGIGQQFTKRLKADNPGRDVLYVQVARGGRNAHAMLDGQELGILRGQLYDTSKLPPATAALFHQGEADRNTDGAVWVATLETVIQQMRNGKVIDDDTAIIFGALAKGPAGAMNAYMGDLLDIPGVIGIAPSFGLETVDGVHFAPKDLNTMGDRMFEIYKGSDMNVGRM